MNLTEGERSVLAELVYEQITNYRHHIPKSTFPKLLAETVTHLEALRDKLRKG